MNKGCFEDIIPLSNPIDYAKIILIPKDKSEGEYIDEPLNTVEENVETLCVNDDNPTEIEVYIGEQYTEPTWHLVEMDLNEVIKKYSISNEEIGKILSISLTGHKYHLDDIMFKKRESFRFYQDADGDGYGDPDIVLVGSDRPDGLWITGGTVMTIIRISILIWMKSAME